MEVTDFTNEISNHILMSRDIEMIQQTSRYALNILGFLAENQGRRTRSHEIARATGIPANYLSKILNQLRKQALVDSEKGWGGGFQLRRKALHTPISEVVAIFEGLENTTRKDCLFGLPECNADDPCPLHSYWERIRGIYHEMLAETRIADLAKAPAGE